MRKIVKVWLVTSEHLEDRLWFREEQDFIVGMNYVAVLVSTSGITVLAFVLMSNHVHFLLVCTREEAERFINEYKRRYSCYLQRKYGIAKGLKDNDIDIREIPEDPEAIAWTVAYIINNSVVANICAHPSLYPWGSGDAYFNSKPIEGSPLDSVSARKRYSLLHSKSDVPGNLLVNGRGYIDPRSYLNARYVEETVFRTPGRMNYYITNSSKAKRRLAAGDDNLPSFRDQSILAAIPDLCRSLFGKRHFSELNGSEKAEFLRQIRYRFSSNVHQIARVAGLTYEEASRLLDSTM